MGRQPGIKFFRYTEIQWSEDSLSFYLIKDETYNSKGSQLFSLHGELTEYDIATGRVRKVFAPFRAFKYFIANGIGVFFHEANDQGDVKLMLGVGGKSVVVEQISREGFRIDKDAISFKTAPFYTFSQMEYTKEILYKKGVILKVEGKNPRVGHLSIKNNRILSVIEGKGVNGRYLGLNSTNSGFLPGERYFLLDLNTESFNGQLLFDLETGHYRPLPENTKLYQNINNHNFSDWTLTKDGVQVNFTQTKQHLPSW